MSVKHFRGGSAVCQTMRVLSSLWLIILSVICVTQCVHCFPGLCSGPSVPLDAITSVTQFVNDSYIVTNYHLQYAVFEGSANVSFNREFSNPSLNRFKHHFSFVVDFDQHCVNVEETLFIIEVSVAHFDHNHHILMIVCTVT